MSTGLNPQYFVSLGLEDYLVDPSTGLPLSNGYIACYEDQQRGTSKPCYQLSGNPPNYTYEALPNPIPLSQTGTPTNASGEVVKIYYYPFDADNNLQLYYLVIYNSSNVPIYEIQAIPNIADSENPEVTSNVYENQLSNSQFVEVSFNSQIGLSLSFTGTITNQAYDVAPNWQIIVSTNGASNLIFNQVALEGSLDVPTNPPYVFQIQSSGAITSLQLVQKLSNNPDIWSSTTSATGYLAGYMLVSSLDGLPHTVSMYYAPSVSPSPQLIVSGSTGISGYTSLSGTVQLTAGVNSQDGNTGYVNIIVDLPVNVSMYITSLQAVGLPDNVNVQYSQETSNRQRDHLFNYYESQLKFKPIPSYLIGWDFPLNPAQFGVSGSLGDIGSNTSAYVWDQTIVYQSVSNSISYQRAAQAARSGLQITATASTKFAVIQYLSMNTVADILNSDLSVCVNMASSADTENIQGSVTLLYCTDSTLPDLNSNLSVVSALNSDGSVETTNGTWIEIPTLTTTDATFVLPGSGNGFFYDFNLQYFQKVTFPSEANFFAIVVGFGTVPSSAVCYFESISLVPGKISTRPAPQAQNEVLRECQYYYEKSYGQGINTGASGMGGELMIPQPLPLSNGSFYEGKLGDFQIIYKEEKIVAPTLIFWPPNGTITEGDIQYGIISLGTYEVPTSGTNPTNESVSSNWNQYSNSTTSVLYQSITSSAVMEFNTSGFPISTSQAQLQIEYSAGARLGLEAYV